MNKRKFVEQVIKEKGEEYVIAALFVDSVGYWTPEAAKNQLEFWKRGMDTCGAERTICMFNWNFTEELYSAIRYFEQAYSEEERQKYINFVKQLSKLDSVDQITAGLMFPSGGV